MSLDMRALALIAGFVLFAGGATGQALTPAQIKQIEEIAKSIASKHNAAAASHIDDVTVFSEARAVGRTVIFANVLKVKKGLTAAQLHAFSDESRKDIFPKACRANAENPAFKRGLSYTFSYTSTRGEKLGEFTVDQAGCAAAK